MAKAFDIETDIHGTRVVVARTPLHPACFSDTEIDYHINSLKSELDVLSKKMKKSCEGPSDKALVSKRLIFQR